MVVTPSATLSKRKSSISIGHENTGDADSDMPDVHSAALASTNVKRRRVEQPEFQTIQSTPSSVGFQIIKI